MKKILYLFILVLCACEPSPRQRTLFDLLTPDSTGIDFSNDLHHTAEFNMYTYRNFYNGGGVGIGDINNDGLADIFFCGNMVDNKLYLNKGHFQFEDITERAGVASSNIWSTGVSFADVNGDGWLDIYVCKSGKPGGEKRHNELFINNQDLTFSEQAERYGIDDEGLSSHAAFFDYDKDGDLDLYLLNNSFRSVGGYDMRPGLREIRDTFGGNKLYQNTLIDENNNAKNEVVFQDVSAVAGIYGSNIGFGLGVTIGDINRDGWQDIYVSNDFFERDYLYINQKDGTFREDLTNQIHEISMGSMGADMADINNDGLPEVFVTEMLPKSDARYKTKTIFENWDKYQLAVNSGYHYQFGRNVLQLNNGNNTFSEIGRLANVEASDWSWSALVSDFDNDGFKDIYISNGIYKDLLDQDYINFYSNDPEIIEGIKNRDSSAILKLIDRIPSEAISNFAFKNNGDLTFSDQTKQWGLFLPSYSNGSAYGDLDNDGDLDLVINNCNMPAFVFRNNTNEISDHHFLQISLTGEGKNQYALGAQVTLTIGDKKIYQELSPMRGFQSSTDYKLTFGIGGATVIDEILVTWPDGMISREKNIKADQRIELQQRKAISPDRKPPAATATLMQSLPDFPLSYQHKENDFVDFDRDRLIFHMISAEGPRMSVGDVNNDQLIDLFLGGASGQPGSLFIQTSDGSFRSTNEKLLEEDRQSEDEEAVFFDADGDGDEDLLVVSGGNEFMRGHM
ncbi:MAG: VCBS repeat-containing protein, partial [Saprospiraceae bacterium]|nr:VCBS repeat-containing protein [Saprospiraceae bacterium]